MDADQVALAAYERFEQYVRPPNASIEDYRIEFDRVVQQLKANKMELPLPLLAYRA